MIDFRHKTFLALCKIGNYTRTAEYLHITQPAVSQHIRFLEELYGGTLFHREGKTLTLTKRGNLLYQFVSVANADSSHVKKLLKNLDRDTHTVSFGATLSIGEYVMPEIIGRCMHRTPDIEFHMQVGNTQTLLTKLQEGEIGFACIEGFFDKTQYDWRLFSKEAFIAVCSPSSPLAEKHLHIEDLLHERLILREKGSGTREILEQLLWENNLPIASFIRLCEVGNMSAIKKLVADGAGITFLYKAAATKELKEGSLKQINLEDFNVVRAFHFVCLKHSMHKEEYLTWFDRFCEARKNP